MIGRVTIIALGIGVFFLTATTLHQTFSDLVTPTMASQIPIKITLAPGPTATSEGPEGTVQLIATIQNTSPDSPVSVLRWSSPLDPKAVPLDVFKFKSVSTGEMAKCIGLQYKRRMPESGYFVPDDEAIVQIAAGGSVEKKILVKAPDVVLEKGEKYMVKATGWWMGVWVGEKDKFGWKDGDGALTGNFESEEVEIEVPA